MFDKVIEEKLNIKETDTIPEVLTKLNAYKSDLKYSINQVNKYINKIINTYDDRKMGFGKYKGKTLKWIKEHDSDYMKWLVDEEVLGVNFKYYLING